MTLEEARELMRQHYEPGVVYRPPHGDAEDGVITAVSEFHGDGYVFVRYRNDATSKATDPALLSPLAGLVKP